MPPRLSGSREWRDKGAGIPRVPLKQCALNRSVHFSFYRKPRDLRCTLLICRPHMFTSSLSCTSVAESTSCTEIPTSYGGLSILHIPT